MDPEAGLTTPNLLEAETNRAMIAAARTLVVVADSSKWGVVGLSAMAQLSQADVLVTDSGLPHGARETLDAAVGRLDVVEVDAGQDAAVDAPSG